MVKAEGVSEWQRKFEVELGREKVRFPAEDSLSLLLQIIDILVSSAYLYNILCHHALSGIRTHSPLTTPSRPLK